MLRLHNFGYYYNIFAICNYNLLDNMTNLLKRYRQTELNYYSTFALHNKT